MSGVLGVLLATHHPYPRLTNRSVSASAEYPNAATAELEFNTNGVLNTVVDNGSGGAVTSRLPEWYGFNYAAGWPAGTHYEIRCTVQSGSSPSSGSAAVDTWLALTSAREWLLFRNSIGTASGTWLIEIRPTGGSAAASATYTMSAECTASGAVTVSGETISDIDLGFVSFAAVRFKSTGIVQKDTNAGANVQIDAATDWIIPNNAASGSYEIRATVTTPPSIGVLDGSALNTWLALSSDREWSLSLSGDSADSAVLLIEIRLGDTVLESGSYTLNVDGIPL